MGILYYRHQLQVYAHLVESRDNVKVSKMHLYYTGEEKDPNPMISFDYKPSEIATTMQSFDEVVHKIINKDFTTTSKDKKTCNDCDLRFYCGKSK